MTKQESDKRSTLAASRELLLSFLSTGDYSLTVTEGPHEGLEVRFERELVRIGRTEWCDLVLDQDQWVSNVHCECWLDEKGVRIRDLRSRNGILIDGNMVLEAYLREGAVFQLGSSKIQLISHHKKRTIPIKYQDESGLLVGKSPQMRNIFSMLGRLGKSNVSTLLAGETGTGKTTVAEALHMQSDRSDGPFVVVNCGALPASLIEAELFGYEKGAFTGAAQRHQGFFEQADGGTLFLDEIAELPLDLQPKLLDVIERRTIRRLGGTEEFKVDFRLITATHRNLQKEIVEKRFREDLFFRLSVVSLEVPALRERTEDIPLLANMLLSDLSTDTPFQLTPDAVQALQNYIWPGNIRELRNTLEHATIFLESPIIDVDDLRISPILGETVEPAQTTPVQMQKDRATASMPTYTGDPPQGLAQGGSALHELLPHFPLGDTSEPFVLKDCLEAIEKELILLTLDETERDAAKAAHLLSISQGWLYNRIRKYGLKTKNKKRK